MEPFNTGTLLVLFTKTEHVIYYVAENNYRLTLRERCAVIVNTVRYPVLLQKQKTLSIQFKISY